MVCFIGGPDRLFDDEEYAGDTGFSPDEGAL